MNKLTKFWCLFIPTLTLMSCDAFLHMTYTVENKSMINVKLFIPECPISPSLLLKDTILVIKPKEKIIVGVGSKFDFPWGTKNIYKNQPGICGLKKIGTDTVVILGCSRSEWKYKRRESKLKIE